MQPIELAAMEESRHLGLATAYGLGLACRKAVARRDGSGAGEITLHARGELAQIYTVDPALALDVITTIAAVGLVGGDTPSPVDQALIDQASYLYRAVHGRSSEGLLARAELRATHFVLTQHEGIKRFAAILAHAGVLMGEDLRERLHVCFKPERRPLMYGQNLQVWLHERKAQAVAEKQAVRRREAARAADALAVYCEIMYPVREKRSEEPKQSRSQSAKSQRLPKSPLGGFGIRTLHVSK